MQALRAFLLLAIIGTVFARTYDTNQDEAHGDTMVTRQISDNPDIPAGIPCLEKILAIVQKMPGIGPIITLLKPLLKPFFERLLGGLSSSNSYGY